MAAKRRLAVILGDPRLPYAYGQDGAFGEDDLQAVEQLKDALGSLSAYEVSYFDDHSTLIGALQEAKPELALNLCDTGYQNRWDHELNVPAFLEMLGVPYTGSGPAAIVLSNDKALVSAAARLRGVRVPNHEFVDLTADPLVTPKTFPSLIKPNVSAGSFGITDKSVVHDAGQAVEVLHWLASELTVPEALIQDYLEGEELTVGVVGNAGHDLTVLPPLSIDWSGLDPSLPRILTHASKADPSSPYWTSLSYQRAELDALVHAEIVSACHKLFGRLGFQDYARFDFRCGADGWPRLIDANVNPTWYANSKMALMASWRGLDYPGFLASILGAAERRAGLA